MIFPKFHYKFRILNPFSVIRYILRNLSLIEFKETFVNECFNIKCTRVKKKFGTIMNCVSAITFKY